MSESFKDDMKIDFYHLHENIQEQASMYMEWGERWANADRHRDKVRQRLSKDIRMNPESYGIMKLSETAINAAIENDEEFIEASYDLHVLEVVKDAFYHRSRALDNLVRLLSTAYFGEGTNQDLSKIHREIEKQNVQMTRMAQLEELQKNKERLTRKE